ncbi:GntR family transcriptional regulator [Tomitella gaofuii]|uniref:GntR family transcriptional regulator n=1 Tax=Tomitella gaofuii TaxID=2760083 RepID=UPI00355824C2
MTAAPDTATGPGATASRATQGRLRRRPQLSDDVADHVRAWIMSGQVRPGAFIRLDETAADLGVSVTPVREALSKLRGEGLVESVPHRGYVVNPLSREDVVDIFWLQGQIAVELSARAARRVTDADLADLTSHCDALESTLAVADVETVALREFEFHRRLNRIAGSDKLAWFLHNAVRYTPYALYAADPGWGATAVAGHRRLIEALRSGDLATVEDETRRQFTDGARRLVAHLDAVHMWDGEARSRG